MKTRQGLGKPVGGAVSEMRGGGYGSTGSGCDVRFSTTAENAGSVKLSVKPIVPLCAGDAPSQAA